MENFRLVCEIVVLIGSIFVILEKVSIFSNKKPKKDGMYISRVVEKTRSGEHEFSRTENEELLRLQNENELLIAERDTLLKKYNNLNFVSKVFIALFLFSKIFRRNK
jgi:hypothetical protein